MNTKRHLVKVGISLALGCLLGLVVAGCTPWFTAGIDGKYDNSHIYAESLDGLLDEVIKSIYRIETSTRFRVKQNIGTLKVAGMAFSLDEKHLLTAKHVTSIDTYQVQTPFGLMHFPLLPEAKIEESTAIVFDDGSRIQAKVIYRDPEMDFAVLEVERKLNAPGYPVGNSEDFRIANLVILPSYFQTGLNIRIGYITQLDYIRYGIKGEVANLNKDIFGISTVVSRGDSGSPILLLRDGKIELGGLVSFILLSARGLGYGLKINPIMDKLKIQQENQKWVLPLLKGR